MGLTVTEYIARTNNPQAKIATEEYAIAIEQRSYWYSLAVKTAGWRPETYFPFVMV
jgi:hypothetical protein